MIKLKEKTMKDSNGNNLNKKGSQTGDLTNYRTTTSADDVNYVYRETFTSPREFVTQIKTTHTNPIETNSYVFNQYKETTIESFTFKKSDDRNLIEVVKRQRVNENICSQGFGKLNDRVFKEIYGISEKDGKKSLQLLKTIEAKVLQAHQVEELIEFDE